jgi:Bacterial protein of unknown function (DUF899)
MSLSIRPRPFVVVGDGHQMEAGMIDPQVVSRDEWLAARRRLLAREKEFTRQRMGWTVP